MTCYQPTTKSPLRLTLAIVCALVAIASQAPADEPYGRSQFSESDREHWSYVPVKRPDVPTPKNQAWVRNPIDSFVLAGLDAAGFEPNGPADRPTLLRRVYLDLIGLAPTPAEQDAFLADTSPEAYQKVVDDLLARPAYGERWGRHWLDVVRFAESNGYERDGDKPSVWRYRDYVIDAFNNDKPYDRFLMEQLAGDELLDANAETCIATSFLRLGPFDDEPADPLVDRYDQLDDVLGTTAATFMGVTLRCARCHDHKFESFTQRDYTRMLAIFEPLKRPQDGRKDLDRMVGAEKEMADYHAASKAAEERVTSLSGELAMTEWKVCKRLADAGVLAAPALKTIVPTSRNEAQAWRYTFTAPAEGWQRPEFDASAWAEGPAGFGAEGTPGGVIRTKWTEKGIWLRRAFAIPAEMLAPERRNQLQLLLHHDDACEVYLNGVLAARLTGFKVEYQPVAITPEALATLKPDGNILAVRCEQTSGGQYIDVGLVANETPTVVATATGGTPGAPGTAAPEATPAVGAELAALPRDAIEAMLVEPPARNDKQRQLVKKFQDKSKRLISVAATAEEKQSIAEMDRRIAEADKSRPAPLTSAYVWFEEATTHPKSNVWRRGNPRESLAEVSAGFPAILVDAPPAEAKPTARSTGRRLQLARWLASAEHPLTARVIVNRIWQHHFGDGVVGTENDFGVMGEPPANQPLLDWLASEFTSGGWRMKALHRLIVMSNTYQMSSERREELAKKDPGDDLLWRYPSRRLEAEAIRDCVLATSGQLNPQRGGPSMYPAISAGVLASQSRPGLGWGKPDPAQVTRRSVYIFVKRTLLAPELEVLDFPDTNGSCEQRMISTVAPQALTWLNGDFIREQARHFAARLANEAGDDDAARVDLAYRLALSRDPTDTERATVRAFLLRHAEQIAADAAAANTPPEKTAADKPAPDKPLDARQAALEGFCLVLLNANEFVYIK